MLGVPRRRRTADDRDGVADCSGFGADIDQQCGDYEINSAGADVNSVNCGSRGSTRCRWQ